MKILYFLYEQKRLKKKKKIRLWTLLFPFKNYFHPKEGFVRSVFSDY